MHTWQAPTTPLQNHHFWHSSPRFHHRSRSTFRASERARPGCEFCNSGLVQQAVTNAGLEFVGRGAMGYKSAVTSSADAGEEPRAAPAPAHPGGDLEAPLLPAEAAGSPPTLENAPRTAQTDTLLYICAILSIITAVGALLCLVVNLISLLRSFDYRGFDYRVSVCLLNSRLLTVFALLVGSPFPVLQLISDSQK